MTSDGDYVFHMSWFGLHSWGFLVFIALAFAFFVGAVMQGVSAMHHREGAKLAGRPTLRDALRVR